MALYHIVTQSLKSSKIYYLAKTIRVNDKVLKVREKIGKIRPLPQEEAELISKPNLSLEIKALEKRLYMSETLVITKYLQPDEIQRLEKSKYWDYMFSLFLTSSEQEYFKINSGIFALY